MYTTVRYKFSKSPLVSEIQDPLTIYNIPYFWRFTAYGRFRGGAVSQKLEDFSKLYMVQYYVPLPGDSKIYIYFILILVRFLISYPRAVRAFCKAVYTVEF